MADDAVGAGLRFLSAMPEWLQEDGQLWFENARWPEGLVSQLSPWRVDGLRPQEIPLGTRWPKPQVIGIHCTEEAVRLLVQVADGLAAPEICDHFHVFEDGQRVASWYDFGDHVAPEFADGVPAERVKELAERP